MADIVVFCSTCPINPRNIMFADEGGGATICLPGQFLKEIVPENKINDAWNLAKSSGLNPSDIGKGLFGREFTFPCPAEARSSLVAVYEIPTP